MAKACQVRGVMLEEVLLVLLRAAGYRTVSEAGIDPTLGTSAAGLTVLGRGARHQVDAIADTRIGQPFSNPQRLLVEAKSYSDHRPVGLPAVRGVAGLLKDVSEFWVARDPANPATSRYHYQAAVFSSSGFTLDAQNYAFAQDIYLVPLAGSSYFRPMLSAIEAAVSVLPTHDGQVVGVVPSALRRELRARLQPDMGPAEPTPHYSWLDTVAEKADLVGDALVATVGRAFPLFLTPCRHQSIASLKPVEEIEIHFRNQQTWNGWTISRKGETTPLFSFDLPERLFLLYADEGVLSFNRATDLKEEVLREFTAVYAPADKIRLFRFVLAHGWLEQIRGDIERSGRWSIHPVRA